MLAADKLSREHPKKLISTASWKLGSSNFSIATFLNQDCGPSGRNALGQTQRLCLKGRVGEQESSCVSCIHMQEPDKAKRCLPAPALHQEVLPGESSGTSALGKIGSKKSENSSAWTPIDHPQPPQHSLSPYSHVGEAVCNHSSAGCLQMWCSNGEHPELLHKAPVKPFTLTSAPVFVRPGAWAAAIKTTCLHIAGHSPDRILLVLQKGRVWFYPEKTRCCACTLRLDKRQD